MMLVYPFPYPFIHTHPDIYVGTLHRMGQHTRKRTMGTNDRDGKRVQGTMSSTRECDHAKGFL